LQCGDDEDHTNEIGGDGGEAYLFLPIFGTTFGYFVFVTTFGTLYDKAIAGAWGRVNGMVCKLMLPVCLILIIFGPIFDRKQGEKLT